MIVSPYQLCLLRWALARLCSWENLVYLGGWFVGCMWTGMARGRLMSAVTGRAALINNSRTDLH